MKGRKRQPVTLPPLLRRAPHAVAELPDIDALAALPPFRAIGNVVAEGTAPVAVAVEGYRIALAQEVLAVRGCPPDRRHRAVLTGLAIFSPVAFRPRLPRVAVRRRRRKTRGIVFRMRCTHHRHRVFWYVAAHTNLTHHALEIQAGKPLDGTWCASPTVGARAPSAPSGPNTPSARSPRRSTRRAAISQRRRGATTRRLRARAGANGRARVRRGGASRISRAHRSR